MYGPHATMLSMLSRQAGAGVPVVVKRHHIAGFSRIQCGMPPAAGSLATIKP
jgi:hypothetical protein